jgi:hypothetical protein
MADFIDWASSDGNWNAGKRQQYIKSTFHSSGGQYIARTEVHLLGKREWKTNVMEQYSKIFSLITVRVAANLETSKSKTKFTLQQAIKAQKGNRGIALHFL